MHRLDLLRMNAQFPAEAKAAPASRVGFDLLHVGEGGGHAIHRRANARQSRRQHDLRAKQIQLLAIAIDTEVDLKIERAERDALHAWRSAQFGEIRKTARSLDNRQDAQAGMRMRQDALDLPARLRLGQHDTGNTPMLD
jgi:hypothetical protein